MPIETSEPAVENSREKFWDELDDSLKIERMRAIIKNLLAQQERFRELLRRFEQHSHGADGHVLVPYFSYDSPSAGIGNAESQWF